MQARRWLGIAGSILGGVIMFDPGAAVAGLSACQWGGRKNQHVAFRDACRTKDQEVQLGLSCDVERSTVTLQPATEAGVYNFKTPQCASGKLLTGGGFDIRDSPPPGFSWMGSKRVQAEPDRWQCVFYTPGGVTIGLECFAHCCAVTADMAPAASTRAVDVGSELPTDQPALGDGPQPDEP